MKPPPLRYVRPRSLPEALELLSSDEDAKVLAGGQSLVPMLNFRLARPSLLVDVTRLPELSGIVRHDDVIEIGAAVRQSVVERSPEVREDCPLMPHALRHVGHVQTRSRGTIGGSLAHADAAAELPALAVALDAEVVAVSPRGERTIAARDLFAGPYFSTLDEDEILTRVRVPRHPGARAGCLELARRAGDFALAGVMGLATPRPDGSLAGVRLAAVGVGATPTRLETVEELLREQRLDDAVAAQAGSLAAEAVDPPGDGHGSAAYRRRVLGVLVERLLKELAR